MLVLELPLLVCAVLFVQMRAQFSFHLASVLFTFEPDVLAAPFTGLSWFFISVSSRTSSSSAWALLFLVRVMTRVAIVTTNIVQINRFHDVAAHQNEDCIGSRTPVAAAADADHGRPMVMMVKMLIMRMLPRTTVAVKRLLLLLLLLIS